MTLPILTQRRIEAAFAKGVYDEMKAELGEATAKRILSSAVIRLAKRSRRRWRGRRRTVCQASFVPLDPAALDRRGRVAYRGFEVDRPRVRFQCTRCRYAEMYRAMGLAEPAPFCRAIATARSARATIATKLQRTQTLMGGATHAISAIGGRSAGVSPSLRVPTGQPAVGARPAIAAPHIDPHPPCIARLLAMATIAHLIRDWL